jgi:hypothetical protein
MRVTRASGPGRRRHFSNRRKSRVAIFFKDPAAIIDYAVDWQSAYLAGQTITASDWSIVPDEPDGLSIIIAAHADGRGVATLAGGRRGHVYRLTNRVTFGDGRRDERSLDVRVEDR